MRTESSAITTRVRLASSGKAVDSEPTRVRRLLRTARCEDEQAHVNMLQKALSFGCERTDSPGLQPAHSFLAPAISRARHKTMAVNSTRKKPMTEILEGMKATNAIFNDEVVG